MIETAQAFGVDIGGSGIKAAPVDLTKGDFAEPRLKILTPEVSTPQAVAKIVKQQLDHFEVPESAPVGIAFPAPIKPGQKLDFMANLDQSWIGVDVTEVFSEACGRPVVVVNDADAAGLAEDDEVPESVRTAALIHVARLYDLRHEGEAPKAAQWLSNRYRKWGV